VKVARFEFQGGEWLGAVQGDSAGVVPIAPAGSDADLVTFIRANPSGAVAQPKGEAVPLEQVKLLAPIRRPWRNIWCVGRNYHAHARELAASVFKDNSSDVAKWPMVFTKVPQCVVGPHDDVSLAADVTSAVDYEAEIAVVIGMGGKNIARAEAMRHLFGYTIVNDVTARDVQMRHQQWDLGKSFDGFCPMGPWIVTADSLRIEETTVRCWVNDELRQEARVSDLIFDIPSLIETISTGITLYPGDVIATGTPAGVGQGMSPPSYLRPMDIVRVEVDGLGAIRNRFV
jgi:2-keto-4-pentenoate hydratase/2-oxohepta-3-ene-1,7-dioic acid hydratase in catechol pathway